MLAPVQAASKLQNDVVLHYFSLYGMCVLTLLILSYLKYVCLHDDNALLVHTHAKKKFNAGRGEEEKY